MLLSFNPRAREGRDRLVRGAQSREVSFNPRAREGRDFNFCISTQKFPCFNPRAREGRDAITTAAPARPHAVSIHAPARGAT